MGKRPVINRPDWTYDQPDDVYRRFYFKSEFKFAIFRSYVDNLSDHNFIIESDICDFLKQERNKKIDNIIEN